MDNDSFPKITIIMFISKSMGFLENGSFKRQWLIDQDKGLRNTRKSLRNGLKSPIDTSQ
jgi:hypothetical protein